jgi:hypothetical protein
MRNTSTIPCSSSPSELCTRFFLSLTIGYFPRIFLTKILHLLLAVPSPSQTFSIITVPSDLYKSQSSSLCHYFLAASFSAFIELCESYTEYGHQNACRLPIYLFLFTFHRSILGYNNL